MRRAETLRKAIYDLEKVVDNPIDPFPAMQELVKLQWQPGQDIGDYIFKVRRKAIHAEPTLKFVAAMVSAQLPKEVQNRGKSTVTEIEKSLDNADVFKFIKEVK